MFFLKHGRIALDSVFMQLREPLRSRIEELNSELLVLWVLKKIVPLRYEWLGERTSRKYENNGIFNRISAISDRVLLQL